MRAGTYTLGKLKDEKDLPFGLFLWQLKIASGRRLGQEIFLYLNLG